MQMAYTKLISSQRLITPAAMQMVFDGLIVEYGAKTGSAVINLICWMARHKNIEAMSVPGLWDRRLSKKYRIENRTSPMMDAVFRTP